MAQKDRNEYARQWRAKNRAKIKAYGAMYRPAWRARNPDKVLAARRKHDWKGREPTRPEPECCEICSEKPNNKRKSLDADHCHLTETFRGWLCGNCNRALGMFRDDILRLRMAINYLERNRGTN